MAIYDDMLEKSYVSNKNAYEQNFNTYMDAYKQQMAAIPEEYNMQRRAAYSNARTSALGVNESLANLGLAGNAYSSPLSGYSESSRLGQDIALQNTLQGLSSAQRTAAQSLQNTIAQAYGQRAQDMATMQSQYNTQRQGYIENVLANAQTYAAQGMKLPQEWQSTYEQSSGEPHSKTMMQLNPQMYTYHYLMDDTERTLYDSYASTGQPEDVQFNRMISDYFNTSKEMSVDTITKFMNTKGYSGDPKQLGKALAASGLISDPDNKEKLDNLMTKMGLTADSFGTYEDAEDYLKGNLSSFMKIDEKTGELKIDGNKLDITGARIRADEMAAITAQAKKIDYNNTGNKKAADFSYKDVEKKDGDFLEFKKDGWKRYVYYNGYWFKVK